MNKTQRAVPLLDPDGFNELAICRSGPMLYNKNDVYVGGALRKYGEFSIDEQVLFAQVLREGMVAVEVGANIGAHTVELARIVGRAGVVFAFEPQRLAFQTLCANLALNQRANVFAQQAAVGATAGSIMVPALDPSTRANFGGLSVGGADGAESVPLVTLDGLDLPICHFIKVDVEGMEVEVLQGARKTIDLYRPILYVENDRAERSAELLALIERHDYAAYWHLAPLFNSGNFAGDSENIFPGVVSVNVLCIPTGSGLRVDGLRRVKSPHDRWDGRAD